MHVYCQAYIVSSSLFIDDIVYVDDGYLNIVVVTVCAGKLSY